jgi:hypothetical protein
VNGPNQTLLELYGNEGLVKEGTELPISVRVAALLLGLGILMKHQKGKGKEEIEEAYAREMARQMEAEKMRATIEALKKQGSVKQAAPMLRKAKGLKRLGQLLTGSRIRELEKATQQRWDVAHRYHRGAVAKDAPKHPTNLALDRYLATLKAHSKKPKGETPEEGLARAKKMLAEFDVHKAADDPKMKQHAKAVKEWEENLKRLSAKGKRRHATADRYSRAWSQEIKDVYGTREKAVEVGVPIAAGVAGLGTLAYLSHRDKKRREKAMGAYGRRKGAVGQAKQAGALMAKEAVGPLIGALGRMGKGVGKVLGGARGPRSAGKLSPLQQRLQGGSVPAFPPTGAAGSKPLISGKTKAKALLGAGVLGTGYLTAKGIGAAKDVLTQPQHSYGGYRPGGALRHRISSYGYAY